MPDGIHLGSFTIHFWGNFFNQDRYSTPTDLPSAIHIDPQLGSLCYKPFSRDILTRFKRAAASSAIG